MASYFPSSDADFTAWLTNFIIILTPHTLELGLTAPDVSALDGAKLTLDMALGDQVAKRAASQAATALKTSERGNVEDILRALVQRIQTSPAMTNELRAALGLPVRDGERTPSTPGDEIPDLYLESVPGKALVHFGTGPTNERTNNKPAWARGCNIYRKRADEDDFSLVAFEMTSPYEDEILGVAADYTYVARYRGRKASDLGNGSSPATIAARGLLAA